MLKFLGTGSAFHTQPGNNSACIRRGKTLILVDCGGLVFDRISSLGLLEGVHDLHIIITHTHPDHVGSLGDLIFYAHYMMNLTPRVYFPDGEWISRLLAVFGVEPHMIRLVPEERPLLRTEALGEVSLQYVPVQHVHNMPCFGFILAAEGQRLYYSGDACAIPDEIIGLLETGVLDRMYQDSSGMIYEGYVHMPFSLIMERIPPHLRNRVVCMHHDRALDLDQVVREGFLLPEYEDGQTR